MRISDVLYFSPKYKFVDVEGFIKNEDYEALVEAFRDRVEGFYLEPAELLVDKGYGFAAGILCWCVIEFLSLYKDPKSEDDLSRIKQWLAKNIKEFATGWEGPGGGILAHRFYKDFRCGLVHEGRIKGVGQFSFDPEVVVDASSEGDDPRITVNPQRLLERLRVTLNDYCKILLGKDPSHVRGLASLLKKKIFQEMGCG